MKEKRIKTTKKKARKTKRNWIDGVEQRPPGVLNDVRFSNLFKVFAGTTQLPPIPTVEARLEYEDDTGEPHYGKKVRYGKTPIPYSPKYEEKDADFMDTVHVKQPKTPKKKAPNAFASPSHIPSPFKGTTVQHPAPKRSASVQAGATKIPAGPRSASAPPTQTDPVKAAKDRNKKK